MKNRLWLHLVPSNYFDTSLITPEEWDMQELDIGQGILTIQSQLQLDSTSLRHLITTTTTQIAYWAYKGRRVVIGIEGNIVSGDGGKTRFREYQTTKYPPLSLYATDCIPQEAKMIHGYELHKQSSVTNLRYSQMKIPCYSFILMNMILLQLQGDEYGV